jgi:SAM-dependent methyltransferase
MLIRYQTFPDRRGSSKSVAKLKALRLPDLTGKSFLDVGCNEGFFCAIAKLAGATLVVGLDRNGDVLGQARQRFPDIEFRQQSWDDDIAGRFDVILFASSIHYAKDQPALLRKLLSLLTPDGVLVLELGLSDGPGEEYVQVRRKAGDVRSYATLAALRRMLSDYAFRLAGPSVNQSGDPVARHVVHIRTLRPMILFFDAPSQSGKSTLVRRLMHGMERGGRRLTQVALDGVMSRMRTALQDEYLAHREVIAAIADFKEAVSTRTDLIMKLLTGRGLLGNLLAFIEDFHRLREALLVVWDGFIPPDAKEEVRCYFEERGYVLWDTTPRSRFRFHRIDADALLEKFWQAGTVPGESGGVLSTQDNAVSGEPIGSLKSGRVVGVLQRCTVTDAGLQLDGWAADLDRRTAVGRFDIRVIGKKTESFEVSRVFRPDPCASLGWNERVELGFTIGIPYASLGGMEAFFSEISQPGSASLSMKVGAITADDGQAYWLPEAPEFKIFWK